jgi:hypothetical protein
MSADHEAIRKIEDLVVHDLRLQDIFVFDKLKNFN